MKALRIATFNLLNFVKPPLACYEYDNIYSNDEWNDKYQWTAKQIKDVDADIIGFQEVFSPDALEGLCKQQGYNYFSCIGEPKKELGYICYSPPVALASKFPIVNAQAVEINETLKKELKLSDDFDLSRDILKAEIEITGFSPVVIYVVHLKSKRPIFDTHSVMRKTPQERLTTVYDDISAQIQGSLGATIQRASEVAMLHSDFMKSQLEKDKPSIVLGDFNDVLSSQALRPLISNDVIQRVNNQMREHLDYSTQHTFERFKLYDAFDLVKTENKPLKKPHSHYYGASGSAIDHILLSHHFNAKNSNAIASVKSFNCLDKHLVSNDFERDKQCSDHALIFVDFAI